MFEIAWKEFTNSGRLTVKRKTFQTEKAMERFITKLFSKDSFCEIIATR